MLVQFNGVWLTNDGTGDAMERAITSTMGATLDGKEMVQDAQFIRAVAETLIDRGNLTHTFTFKVARNFQLLYPNAANPIALATSFAFTHFTSLPKAGILLLACGGWGETPIYVQANNAVLAGCGTSSRGVAVDASYSLRCGPLAVVNVAGGGGAAVRSVFTDPSGITLTDPAGNPLTPP